MGGACKSQATNGVRMVDGGQAAHHTNVELKCGAARNPTTPLCLYVVQKKARIEDRKYRVPEESRPNA
jgi:hypothetical protein